MPALIILTIIRFWCDSALQNKIKLVNILCFHWFMFRWGNREPRNYTYIILMPKKCMFLSKFCPLDPSLEYFVNLAVRTLLIPITYTHFGQQAPLPLDAMLPAQLVFYCSRCPHSGHLAWPHDCRDPPKLFSGVSSDLSSVILPSSSPAAKENRLKRIPCHPTFI